MDYRKFDSWEEKAYRHLNSKKYKGDIADWSPKAAFVRGYTTAMQDLEAKLKHCERAQ